MAKKFFLFLRKVFFDSKKFFFDGFPELQVTDLTCKGLDDYSLRCLSNGEFQSVVFARSVSIAVFVSNLLRMIKQDRIDVDGVAASLHGPTPPDKHKVQPLLGEITSTIKSHAPAPTTTTTPSAESAELAKAKRKLLEAGIAVTEKKHPPAQAGRSSTGQPLPTTVEKFPAGKILGTHFGYESCFRQIPQES